MLDGLMSKANSFLWLMVWKYLGSLMYTVLGACAWTYYHGPSFIHSSSFVHLQINYLCSILEPHTTIFPIHKSYSHIAGVTTMEMRTSLMLSLVTPNIFSTIPMWFCRRQALAKTLLKALTHQCCLHIQHFRVYDEVLTSRSCNFLLTPHKHLFGHCSSKVC